MVPTNNLPTLSWCPSSKNLYTSCEDFRKSSRSVYGFEEYCGPNVYGNNVTMCGIIFNPTNDSTKAINSGYLKISSHLNIVYILESTLICLTKLKNSALLDNVMDTWICH